MNKIKQPHTIQLHGNGTKFKENTSYLIKELTFKKEWVKAKYSHREDRNENYYFIFNIDSEYIYLIKCNKCINALYEITKL
jgi:hypothetical protein